jgi:protein SCO1/2
MRNPNDGLRQVPRIRRHRKWIWLVAFVVPATGACIWVVSASSRAVDHSRLTPNDIPSAVGIDQKLSAQVPLDILLHDETGADVRLGDLSSGKPILLNLVYYECPMLCNMTMDGQVRSLTELRLNAGDDFTAITVSFDPREKHELAAAAKRTALARYGRDGADRGWRFLTGDEKEIHRLTDAVGFRYKFDDASGQYAHAAGLVVLTPGGVVSRYLYGVEFPPRDLRLALIEASGGKVGSPSDQVLLLCYHYDPTTGKYGLAIMNLLRLAGIATVIGMGTAIVVMSRRDGKQRRSDSQSVPSERPIEIPSHERH